MNIKPVAFVWGVACLAWGLPLTALRAVADQDSATVDPLLSDSRADSPKDRPNIIFLLTDDQRDNTIAAMGHPFVQTPHLDRLMRDSVRFRNAYIATPVCCPSRISYLTGMTERVHGVGFSSSYNLTEAQWERTYPSLLRKGGYFTGFIGKFGVEYYAFKGRAADKFDFRWAHDGWTKFLPKDFNTANCLPYHDAKEDIITPIMGEAMTRFLDTAPGDKPFCLSVSFNVPHGSQTTSMFTGYADWQKMTRPASENPRRKGAALRPCVEDSLPHPRSAHSAGATRTPARSTRLQSRLPPHHPRLRRHRRAHGNGGPQPAPPRGGPFHCLARRALSRKPFHPARQPLPGGVAHEALEIHPHV